MAGTPSALTADPRRPRLGAQDVEPHRHPDRRGEGDLEDVVAERVAEEPGDRVVVVLDHERVAVDGVGGHQVGR